jgi:Pyridine nucleotide-disulphide oxidoreductase.
MKQKQQWKVSAKLSLTLLSLQQVLCRLNHRLRALIYPMWFSQMMCWMAKYSQVQIVSSLVWSSGAETAHHLAQQLRNVTVLEMGDSIAKEEAIANRWQLLKSLEERKVNLMTSVKVVEIKRKCSHY